MCKLIGAADLHFGDDLVGICHGHPNLMYSHEYNLGILEHYHFQIPEGWQNTIVIAIAIKSIEKGGVKYICLVREIIQYVKNLLIILKEG